MPKILLIDDDEYIRELYSEVLKDAHFEVDTAEDGESGLQKIQNGIYNLIILDIMMPKMDGIMLLKKLKNSPLKCPIVILTNLDHDPLRKESLSLGAADYLIKAEYTPNTFVEKIKSYIKTSTPSSLTK